MSDFMKEAEDIIFKKALEMDLSPIAVFNKQYFDAQVKEGFSDKQALALTISMQETIVAHSLPKGDD